MSTLRTKIMASQRKNNIRNKTCIYNKITGHFNYFKYVGYCMIYENKILYQQILNYSRIVGEINQAFQSNLVKNVHELKFARLARSTLLYGSKV
jgi:hypothetical protein